RYPGLLGQRDDGADLVEARLGLDRQEIRPGPGQGDDAQAVELGVLTRGQPVVAGVFGTVAQPSPIGADGTGDESPGRTRGLGDLLGGRAGDVHAVGDEATAVL